MNTMNTDPQNDLIADLRALQESIDSRSHHIASVATRAIAEIERLRAVPAPVAEGDLIDRMADAFLCWPLPESVCADGCATKQGKGRIGTNLLSATEARQMFRDVVGPILADKLNRAPVAPSQWVKTAPTESDWYWHWNGDPDCGPVPVSVLWSGTTGKCFVSAGQLGIERAVDCEEYGGLWQRIVEPPTQLPDGTLPELPKEAELTDREVDRLIADALADPPKTERLEAHLSKKAAEEQRGYNWAGVEAPKPTEPSAESEVWAKCLENIASTDYLTDLGKKELRKAADLLRSQAKELLRLRVQGEMRDEDWHVVAMKNKAVADAEKFRADRAEAELAEARDAFRSIADAGSRARQELHAAEDKLQNLAEQLALEKMSLEPILNSRESLRGENNRLQVHVENLLDAKKSAEAKLAAAERNAGHIPGLLPIVDSAMSVCHFSKTTEWPLPGTEKFGEYCRILDQLATDIQRAYPQFNVNVQKSLAQSATKEGTPV